MTEQNRTSDQWANLTAHNTMSVPARAKRLVFIESIDQLISVADQAKQDSQPFLVLGEGSNTVFLDDFLGTVARMAIQGIEVINQSAGSISVKVAAGENWHDFVSYCVDQGWYGLENLALIPGLVGAAPIQNIGAYGVEVKSLIHSVEALDLSTGKLLEIANEDCEFAYRDSRFKHAWKGNKVITSVTFKLSAEPSINVTYPALLTQIERLFGLTEKHHICPKHVFEAVVAIRSEKLPAPNKIPNAGSFFKNPVVTKNKHHELKTAFPNMASYPHANGFKLAAAWLIEQRGWKEKSLDGVSVHQSQALVVINPNKRTGASILRFAQEVQADIFDAFGVQLEIEPVLI